MSKLLPPSKPNQTAGWVDKIINRFQLSLEGCQFVIVCVRGYYNESMGESRYNDRGIYDDAFFIRNLKTGLFAPFNGNADPALYREGIASVQEDQVVWYKKGRHGLGKPTEHWALRQARPLKVKRDNGKGGYTYHAPSWPWTNLHRGGSKGTSSIGCLTVPPSQWDSFLALAYVQLKESNQAEVPCVLVELAG
jgi:hypothetical protein